MNTQATTHQGWMTDYRVDEPPAPAGRPGPRHAWIWPLLTLLAAVAGSAGSLDAPTLYAALDKPAWAPPAWAFGPVWALLYALMAFAAWQVARSGSRLRVPALGLYLGQLVANAAWSWAFFAWRDGLLALGVVAALWLLLVACALLFGAVRRSAGVLMLPVIAWVSMAVALNHDVWQRNPGLLG